MNKFFLCFLIFCGACTVFSQARRNNEYSGEIIFADGSSYKIIDQINLDKIPLKADAVTIQNKIVKGVLFDFGESSFSISRNTVAAISNKNKLLASQIKNKVYMGIGIKQNENRVTIHGFRSVNNLDQLTACIQSKKVCQIEAQVVLIEIKMKDKTENFVLARTMKPVDD